MASNHILLDAVTEDTTGDGKRFHASMFTVFVDGDLGGGTLTLEMARDISDAAGPWETIYTVTTERRINFFAAGKYWLRAILTGSTNPDLTVAVN